MAELQTATCDVCGAVKREQNHWFRVWIVPGLNKQSDMVAITLWNFTAWDLSHFHCCGEEHALRKAGELLGKIGADKAAALAPDTELLQTVEPKQD